MEGELKRILSVPWFAKALSAVAKLDTDAWIAGGCIRTLVWNDIHKLPSTHHLQDIDVIYYGDLDNSASYEAKLMQSIPELTWEVVNQAHGHLFSHGTGITRPQVHSIEESIKYWAETCTCVAVRKTQTGIEILAPHGLEDLFACIIRPVPRPYYDKKFFKWRREQKNWPQIWSNVQVVKLPNA